MTKRELKSAPKNLPRTPIVAITQKANLSFIGVLQNEGRKVALPLGEKTVYEFTVVDGTAPIEKKLDDGSYVEIDVNQGDTVSLFATKSLAEKIGLAKVGEKLEILYHGKIKLKSGFSMHNFSVNVLED